MAKKTKKAAKKPAKKTKAPTRKVKKSAKKSAKKTSRPAATKKSKPKKRTGKWRDIKLPILDQPGQDNRKQFLDFLQTISDGTVSRANFDAFVFDAAWPIYVPAPGDQLKTSVYTLVISHSDPPDPADLGVRLDKIEMK